MPTSRTLAPTLDGLRIEFGGNDFSEFEPPASEALGLAFAIVILILAFGSVLSMGLPIGVALAGIGIGSALIALLSNVMTMPDVATTLGVMIGLGVGIDYALFIVTRYREQLHEGHTVSQAVSVAIDTSGRAVAFAGLTVVISLMGMLLMGIEMVRGLGIGAAVVVVVTMVASLTLLPALLGFAGTRVEVTRWRGLVAAGPRGGRTGRRGPQDPAAAGRHPPGDHRADRQLRHRPPAPGGAAPPAQAGARDLGLPVEPRHPAPPLDLDARQRRPS